MLLETLLGAEVPGLKHNATLRMHKLANVNRALNVAQEQAPAMLRSFRSSSVMRVLCCVLCERDRSMLAEERRREGVSE